MRDIYCKVLSHKSFLSNFYVPEYAIMTKSVKNKKKPGMGGGVSATPKEMARAKHQLINNKEEKAR